MAVKDDLQNLGGDVGPPQHRFLLGLFSGLLDRVSSPGIALARLMLSSGAVNDTINDILVSRTYGVSTA